MKKQKTKLTITPAGLFWIPYMTVVGYGIVWGLRKLFGG